jgi:ABC-2 type transport system ATP-binding protein
MEQETADIAIRTESSTDMDLHIESVSLRKLTLDAEFLHHTGKKIRYSGPDDRKRRRGIRRMSRNAR